MVSKAKLLIHSSKLWPPCRAIQPKESTTVKARKLARVAEKRLRQIAPLLVRVNRYLMNERGGPVRSLGPEQAVFQLKSKDRDRILIVERHVVHAGANMLLHRRFTHLLRSP